MRAVQCALAAMQVGIVGLVEEDWLETLGAVDTTEMEYRDFVEVGRRLATELRVRRGAASAHAPAPPACLPGWLAGWLAG